MGNVRIDGLAALQASGSLVIPEEDSLLNPDPAAVGLARARLVYTDRSLLQRLLIAWGEPSGFDAEMVADAFAGMLAESSVTPWLKSALAHCPCRLSPPTGAARDRAHPAGPAHPG